MATRGQPSTVRLRRLAGALRRMREEAKLTRDDVVEKTGLNVVTLWRIETAKVRPQRRNLLALLDLYGVTDEKRRSALVELCGQADQIGWLQQYENELTEQYLAYVSFESEARSVRNYESLFVPGLLQTEAYARAILTGVVPLATEREVEHRTRVRMQRQAVLCREDPLQLWAVLDEAALHRVVGGVAVMREQLHALAAAARLPHVTLQVIPFGVGAHPGMPGSFVILDFSDPADRELVHVDGMASAQFLERDNEIRDFSLTFQHLVASALNLADSMALLHRRIDALAREETGDEGN